MFTVRELAELVRRLDERAFVKQMGPFALMQRPAPEAREERARADKGGATTQNPVLKLRGNRSTIDFGDLMIATLPPPSADGSMQLVIGRSPDCDLVVLDTSVSKQHARVTWNGRDAVLEELGSVNGTFINNLKMKDRWTMRDGDELTFGESHFLFLWAASLHARLRSLR